MMPDKFYHDPTPLPWQRKLGLLATMPRLQENNTELETQLYRC